MSEEEHVKVKKSELKELIDRKLENKLSNKNSSEASVNDSRDITRRQFLKKAGLGALGLSTLIGPVSADYFIKDDSFSVQTSNDGGSTLTEGLFVTQNADVEIPNGNLDMRNNDLVNVGRLNGISADNITTSIENNSTGIFGSGKDGAITVSSNEALTNNIYATSYTVQSGSEVYAANGAVVIHATQEITVDGIISASGAGASGGAAGVYGASDSSGNDGNVGELNSVINSFAEGGAGGTAGGGDGQSALKSGGGGGGGSGEEKLGDSGPGSPGGGLNSKTLSDVSANNINNYGLGKVWNKIYDHDLVAGSGGAGGGAGSRGDSDYSDVGSSSGADGGDGGSGGGVVVLIAPKIKGSGTVNASGEDGKDGKYPPKDNVKRSGTAYGGAGGGGGGGAGGAVITITNSLSNDLSLDVSGGAGGIGESGRGGSGSGGDGAAGASGEVINIDYV